MRDEVPVYYSERWGWWALTRFDDVRAAALDPDTFRSFEGMDIDDTALEQAPPGFLGNMDNPRHDEVRKVVQPYFLPRRVAKLEDGIRAVVRDLIASWRDRGEVDLAHELAWPMPFDVFYHVMGLPGKSEESPEQHARREQLERWTHELKDRVPGTPHLGPKAKAATASIQQYFIDLLNDRRRNERDDLVTKLVNADIDGVPFAEEEITPVSEISGLMMILFLGGVESTAGLTGTMFKLLAENPDQRALLRQDPSLIPDAVEETMRWATPLQLTARTTSREVTLHGVTIPKGRRVVLVVGAANRDERQFPDPDRFDITRGRFRHLGFGEAVHGCLGAPLARLEAKIAAEEAIPVLGEYELSGAPTFYPTTPNMYVWKNLPVSFSVSGPSKVRPSTTLASESPASSAAPVERPEDLTVFFDPLSYTAYDDPYEVYRELRRVAPVYYNPRRDLYVVSRYEDVRACLRNHEQLVNALGDDMDGSHDSYGPGNLIAVDEPHHGVLREVVLPSFAPQVIMAMEGHIRRLARGLLAGLFERGGGEFAGEFALPLVFGVALRLLGAPGSDTRFWQERLRRSMARTVGQFGIPADAANSNREAEERLAEILRRCRGEIAAGTRADGPDAISRLLAAGADGVLDEAEQVGLAHLILSASTDVAAALVTNCIAVLDRYPPLQRYLHGNPAMAGAFVEETLRYESPAKNMCRQTAGEVTIAGVSIPANSRVMVLLASANRDERVYANPDSFDIFRVFTEENKVLAFGEGIHACLGAPLARLVARVAVEELAAGLDGTEAHIAGTPERWAKQMARGFATLPVRIVSSAPVRIVRKPHVSTTHLTSVQRRGTRLTLTTREFETAVRVDSKEFVADGVAALTLRDPDERPLPRWEPGAHVDLILDGAPTRQYSLCGDPDDLHAWRLGILRDAGGGGGSLYVHDQLQTGDLVRVRGPRNNFPLAESPRYLFIAGGIGITPVLPMIRAAAAAGADWRLVYGGRRRASMAFLEELSGYGDRVSVRPQEESGLLDLDSLLGQPQPDTKVYCCGPEPLLAAVERGCAAWPKRSLHVERFAARPVAEPVLHEAFEVHLAQSELTLTVPPGKSILDMVEEAGVGVLSSCREGTCGTCEVPLLEGVPDHRDSVLDQEAREAGNCLMICISRSRTPRLVLDL
jgi:cytochrome P450/ferredoxin-NADP reductase